jgi:hypothetical protein
MLMIDTYGTEIASFRRSIACLQLSYIQISVQCYKRSGGRIVVCMDGSRTQ